MPPDGNAPEIGRDALDPAGPAPRWLQLFPARHAALGLRPSTAPLLGFVAAGVVLGPAGLGVLNARALANLDIVVSIALAALGVFVGLGVGGLRAAGPRVALAGLLQAVLTIAVVAAGLLTLLTEWGVPLPIDAWLFVGTIAICSCASAAATAPRDAQQATISARIVNLDDLPLILLGTGVVSYAAGGPIAITIALTVAAALLAGVAGWLLFDRTTSEAERGVFVTGAILLLGGIAVYSGTSPLLSGFVAAVFWTRAPGETDRIVATDLGKLQHPLVALLLIVAGASMEWTLALLWIATPLVLLRFVGKLLGSAAAAGIARVPPGLLAVVLVPPGVLGVALALNVQQVLGARGALLLSAVTLMAVVSELLSAVLPVDVGARR